MLYLTFHGSSFLCHIANLARVLLLYQIVVPIFRKFLFRNHCLLYTLPKVEPNHGEPKDYSTAVVCLNKLINFFLDIYDNQLGQHLKCVSIDITL